MKEIRLTELLKFMTESSEPYPVHCNARPASAMAWALLQTMQKDVSRSLQGMTVLTVARRQKTGQIRRKKMRKMGKVGSKG